MGSVIAFPQSRQRHIKVFDGVLSTSLVNDVAGWHELESERGKRCYFLDLVEPGGNRLNLWGGFDRSKALDTANECAVDFGVPIDNQMGAA